MKFDAIQFSIAEDSEKTYSKWLQAVSNEIYLILLRVENWRFVVDTYKLWIDIHWS